MMREASGVFVLLLLGTCYQQNSSFRFTALPTSLSRYSKHDQVSSALTDLRRSSTSNNNAASKVFVPKHFVRSSGPLFVGNWWEDDLPNILGINPFEAALLFGALYKFYGPSVLYEFAREAGKLFSTYAPIVRDLSLDIFNEGKDYLEEDRDRELLRKGGVDVENMPRKTTNIIERFQAGMEVRKYNLI